MEALLKKVLAEIKPTKEEEKKIHEAVSEITDRINRNIKDAKAVLGGSGAKGTWLKSFDADIFVKFKYKKFKDKDNLLSNLLEKALKKAGIKTERIHGSRDYFQLTHKRYLFEIIPILEIKKSEDAKNITDISPLHTEWVKKHKQLADEIRLTKQFFKAQKVYGAESHIKGFSGYVCEILTVHYGSFKRLMGAASKWKEKTAIDPANYYKGKNIFMELNKSKLASPLIIIDPVQKERNAAAALSFDKFDALRKAANTFVSKPSYTFFKRAAISPEDILKSNKQKKVIFAMAAPKEGKEDVVGSKLLKAFERIKTEFEIKGFKIYSSGWEWDEGSPALFYYVADKNPLSEYEERQGPIVNSKKFAEDFKKTHKDTFIQGNRIFAKVKRKLRTAEKFMESIKYDEYLASRTAKFEYEIHG